MIIGIGTDIIEIDRIKKAVTHTFLTRFFSACENELFIKNNLRHDMIAGNFAAKEAFVKALGTGFVGVDPIEVETLRDEKGMPYIKCSGRAKKLMEELGALKIHVTISHTKNNAVATVLLEG